MDEADAKPLAKMRAQAGLSQRDLAERAQVHHLTVNALENNPKRIPHPRTMAKVAAAIGCQITDIKEFLRVRRTSKRRTAKTRSRRQPALA